MDDRREFPPELEENSSTASVAEEGKRRWVQGSEEQDDIKLARTQNLQAITEGTFLMCDAGRSVESLEEWKA